MEFIKVMLVDDDHLMLHDMQRLVDWHGMGFEIAAVAYNGKLGIELCEQRKPQVIFTDIRMPIMDGLEMMKAIRASHGNALFVILSAYGEFKFAQQALSYGAFAYILKDDINKESLIAIAKSIKKAICQQAQTAFMSICNAVQQYLMATRLEPEALSAKLEEYFRLYCDCGEDSWDIKSLSRRLGVMIEAERKESGRAERKEGGRQNLDISGPPETKDALFQWVCQQAQAIHRWRLENRDGLSSHVSKAMLFIEDNYSDQDLGIQKIADSLQMSMSWLSVCFKKETGSTINDYIISTRIDMAKKLLRHGGHKIYEVAKLSGFRTSQYFSKVFFQETMQLPQHYRKEL